MSYKFYEEYDDSTTGNLKQNYSEILSRIGEDVSREGIEKTPERAAKSMQFLTQGYTLDPEKILKEAMFQEAYDEMRSEERRVWKECER